MTSCSAGWWTKSKNVSLLVWTISLPIAFSFISALIYYALLQRKRAINFLATNNAWLVWYIVTILLSVLFFLTIGIGIVFRNPKLTDWLHNYPGVLALGVFSSITAFWIFSRKGMPWRKNSAVVSIPDFKPIENILN
jgi:drug/metabolite transporter (DMT)-like permease